MKNLFITMFALALTVSVGAAGSAQAQSPRSQSDESWITLQGDVTEVGAYTFELDYGDGTVTVEFDDWDADLDTLGLIEGDDVTVNGRVDDSLYEETSVEASSVFVENIDEYFYASALDEEGDYEYDDFVGLPEPLDEGEVAIQGTVTSVDVPEDEFQIVTDTTVLTVDTATLSYDPLDSDGRRMIEVGDRVSVFGDFYPEFPTETTLYADAVIELSVD